MELDMKHWRPSPIFPDRYLISDDGRVYSIKSRKLLRPCVRKDGRYECILSYEGKNVHTKIHKLVALAFVPNPDGKPQVDHINGIVSDNRASNLRWATNLENARNPITLAMYRENRIKRFNMARTKRHRFGLANRKPIRVYQNGNFVGVFESVRATADYVGVSKEMVRNYLTGRYKNSKGFTFEKVDNKI